MGVTLLEYPRMSSAQTIDLSSAAEVAARLGVKPGTVLLWYREGRIPGLKLSHKVLRFRLSEVVAALEFRQGREVAS